MPTEPSHLERAARRSRPTGSGQVAAIGVDGSPAPAPGSPAALLHSQRHAGNSAVAAIVASLERGARGSQRDHSVYRTPAAPGAARMLGAAATYRQTRALLRDDSATAAPADGASTQTWDPPHFYDGDGLVPVTDHLQARNNLQMISLTMQQLAEWGIPLAAVMQGKADETRGAMPEQGTLTAAEVASLTTLRDASQLVYSAGMKQMNDDYTRSLSAYKMPDELDEAREKAADAMHEAFNKDEDALAKAKQLSENVHLAEENFHYVIEWAEQSLNEVKMLDAEGIMAAQYLESAKSTFGHIVERAGDLVSWAAAIHGAMQAAWSTAEAIAAAHDSSQTSTQQAAKGLEAGTSVVSGILSGGVLVGLEGAASVGLVWADLILPETQAALKAVEHMDEVLGAGALQSQAEWWDEAAKSGGDPPVIPKQYLSQNWFPGGQATLDYMWAVFQGNPPDEAPAAVTKFFYDSRKKMNVEHSEGDQLETSWHLLSPNEVKNLKDWVVANKVEVWEMLYGSLSHP
jgi:hypothetical protein